MNKRALLLIVGLLVLAGGGLLLASLVRPAAKAQDPASAATSQFKPVVSQAVSFNVSPAVRDIPLAKAANIDPDKIIGETVPKQIRKVPNQGLPRGQNKEGDLGSYDGALQSFYPERESTSAAMSALAPAAELSFEGLSSDDNANVLGARYLPPDTVGDVGPNHYVQAVNTLVEIFDKS